MKLFRIEHGQNANGMWYNESGQFDPFIMKLEEGKSKDLDMTWHERYRLNDRSWFSACPDQSLLQSWFSHRDVEELIENDYKLYELEVVEFAIEEFQVLYTNEGLISKTELDLESLWNIDIQEVKVRSVRVQNN